MCQDHAIRLRHAGPDSEPHNGLTDEFTDECADEFTHECTDEFADECTDEFTHERTDEFADECTDECADEYGVHGWHIRQHERMSIWVLLDQQRKRLYHCDFESWLQLRREWLLVH